MRAAASRSIRRRRVQSVAASSAAGKAGLGTEVSLTLARGKTIAFVVAPHSPAHWRR